MHDLLSLLMRWRFFEADIDLARYGFGIACSFQSRVDEHLKRGSLVTLRIKAPPVWLDVRWASPSRPGLPQIATALIRNLKTTYVFAIRRFAP